MVQQPPPYSMPEDVIRKPKAQRYLEQLLKRDFPLLLFPRHLEFRFQRFYSQRYRSYIQSVLLTGILMIFFIGVLDIALVDKQLLHYSFRFMLMVPILGVGILFTFTPSYLHNEQATSLVLIILMAVTMLGLAYIQPQAFKDIYINGVLIIVLFLFAISRLQFWYSVIAGLVIAINYHVTLLINHTFLSYRFIAHSYLYSCALVLALLANYLMEKSIRKQFIQNRLLTIERTKLAKLNQKLTYLVNLDGLTGVANQRHFKLAFADEWKRALRHQYPLSVLLIDFDHFKAYNDSYGHLAGDGCLRQFAQAINKLTRRQGDLFARYGGDEFVMLLCGSELADAETIANKAQTIIKDLNIPNKNSPITDRVTCTIGVSSLLPTSDTTAKQLFEQADKALYLAKHQGRNRVQVFNATINQYMAINSLSDTIA